MAMAEKIPDPTEKYVGSRVRMRRMMLGISQKKLGYATWAVGENASVLVLMQNQDQACWGGRPSRVRFAPNVNVSDCGATRALDRSVPRAHPAPDKAPAPRFLLSNWK